MNMSSGIRVVPATMAHAPFVLDSFRREIPSTGEIQRSLVWYHVTALESVLRGGLGRVVVAHPIGFPDTYVGWAAENCGSLIFAYVPSNLRGFGLARQIVSTLFDSAPIGLVYWTRTAERVKRSGFPIDRDWRTFVRMCKFAEKRAHWANRNERQKKAE